MDIHAMIEELLEVVFFIVSVSRLYNENQWDKCTQKDQPLSCGRGGPILEHVHVLGENKNLNRGSQGDKPGMTVLAKASGNITDQPKLVSLESTVEDQF
jgi:hypothetical protein